MKNEHINNSIRKSCEELTKSDSEIGYHLDNIVLLSMKKSPNEESIQKYRELFGI